MPVPLIPRRVLFGNPDRISPSISPDGTLLAYVAPDEDVLNVWVGPLDGSEPAKPVTHDRDRGIQAYAFCHDDRHLVYLQDTDGNESWRVYALDLHTGDTRLLTPDKDVQARILGHNRWHPHTMLIGLNADNPQLHDVYRLDISTGEMEKIEDNPGFADWLVDSDLQVRGGAVMNADGSVTLLTRDESGEWTPYLEIPQADSANTDVLGFTRDGQAMLLLSSLDSNTTRLIRRDLASGAEETLAQNDRYDVSGVWLHPETLEPQVVTVLEDRQTYDVLDPELRDDLVRLRGKTTGELGVVRSERTDRLWLVADGPSDGPTRYSVYDRATGDLRFLFSHRPELDDYQLAPMESFALDARDGSRLEGYVTFPPETERQNLPAVLLVHGGPWGRDAWGLDLAAQWFANRGYICVQVNFRGSTGYGKDFVNAGDKEWGRAMHTDLLDAVDYVVERGWVDRDRIAIYGGSYGGYAALAGAAFTPDVFRCAVDLCGPSNLLTLIASVPEYWQPLIAQFHTRIGDPETEKDMLWDRSPLSRVDDIRIPVLVGQGANDPRVKQAEAEQIVEALKDKGVEHEYLLFPDEGHGLVKPANRERFQAAAERFLAQHLGGRSED